MKRLLLTVALLCGLALPAGAQNSIFNPIAGTSTGLIGVQVISATGTYTPTAGTKSIVIEVQAQGGGGGGCGATSAVQNCVAIGGGAGSYAKVRYTTLANFSGATVTIGTAGAGGAAGANNGVAGGVASFILAGGGSNASISCPGGTQGLGSGPFTATTGQVIPGNGAAATCTIANGTTIMNVAGAGANLGVSAGVLGQDVSGSGGSSILGSGGVPSSGNNNGAVGTGNGGGGSAGVGSNGAATAGGNPSVGVVIVSEYSL